MFLSSSSLIKNRFFNDEILPTCLIVSGFLVIFSFFIEMYAMKLAKKPGVKEIKPWLNPDVKDHHHFDGDH